VTREPSAARLKSRGWASPFEDPAPVSLACRNRETLFWYCLCQDPPVIGASHWNSLEIAKLIVGILTPIFLFVLGYMVTRAARGVEQAQWASRKLIETRLELYEDMAPLLNDILVFFLLVGRFQEITPPEVIERKRKVDRIYHTHASLFSADFQKLYRSFITTCFDERGGGPGTPAPIRAWMPAQKWERKRKWQDDWDDGWFVEIREEVSSQEQVQAAYDALMNAFAIDVGVKPGALPRR
jgi:hypothetical protein